jgi:hypothetical protein
MRVHVDEARADDVPLSIDDSRGLYASEVPPQDPHALFFNPHSSIKTGITGAIDDHTIANEQIEHE